MWDWLHALARRAGVTPIGAHFLRHDADTRLTRENHGNVTCPEDARAREHCDHQGLCRLVRRVPRHTAHRLVGRAQPARLVPLIMGTRCSPLHKARDAVEVSGVYVQPSRQTLGCAPPSPFFRKRQDWERNRSMARVSLWWSRPDRTYAACSSAHTAPHRSWNT